MMVDGWDAQLNPTPNPHAYTHPIDPTQPYPIPHINPQVDFLQWKSDANIREVKILRRYHIQDREDYVK